MFGTNGAKVWIVSRLEIRKSYGDGVLSIAWFMLRPLVFIFAVFLVVNSGIRGERLQSLDPRSFLALIGAYSIWYMISECMLGSIDRVGKSRTFVLSHHLPPHALAFVSVAMSIINFTVMYVASVALLSYEHGVTVNSILLSLVVYIAVLLMGLTASYLVLVISLLHRNMSVIIPVLLQFGFWLTPIFWRAPAGGFGRVIAEFNPIFAPIEIFRTGLVDGQVVSLGTLLALITVSGSVAIAAFYCARLLSRNAMDFV